MITVEMRNEDGVVTSRLRIDEPVFSVGRSPECGVLVDDPFVDPEHLVVSRLPDGSGVSVQDPGSKNGTKVGGRTLSSESVTAAWGTPIVIGQTTLYLRDPEAPVAEARELPANDGRLLDYSRIPAWTTAGVAVLMLALWAGSAMYAPIGAAEAVGLLIGMFALVMLWTGFWAGVSRLFAGRARFRAHLGFGAACALVMIPISIPLGWLSFAADHVVVDIVLNWLILGFGLWTFVLFGHIDIASRRPFAFKAGLACLLSLSLMGVGWGFTQTEGTPVDQVQRELLVLSPVPDAMTRTESLDDFMARIEEIPALHDRDAEKAESK